MLRLLFVRSDVQGQRQNGLTPCTQKNSINFASFWIGEIQTASIYKYSSINNLNTKVYGVHNHKTRQKFVQTLTRIRFLNINHMMADSLYRQSWGVRKSRTDNIISMEWSNGGGYRLPQGGPGGPSGASTSSPWCWWTAWFLSSWYGVIGSIVDDPGGLLRAWSGAGMERACWGMSSSSCWLVHIHTELLKGQWGTKAFPRATHLWRWWVKALTTLK